jgi:hypothetical protein
MVKFILVNHRTPCGSSTCTECSQSLGPGYLRDVSTRRPYCGFDCYLQYEMKSLSMPWLALTRADHGSATNYRDPFGMISSLAAVSCWCYAVQMGAVSMSVAEAGLRMRELLTADEPGPS